MKAFYEKADNQVLARCQEFIEKNINSSGDYSVYKNALNLYVQLSESMLASHKEFDDAIKREMDDIIVLEEGIEKDLAFNRFKQKNYCLYLDRDAHGVLKKLETIKENNKNKGIFYHEKPPAI